MTFMMRNLNKRDALSPISMFTRLYMKAKNWDMCVIFKILKLYPCIYLFIGFVRLTLSNVNQ